MRNSGLTTDGQTDGQTDGEKSAHVELRFAAKKCLFLYQPDNGPFPLTSMGSLVNSEHSE